MVAFTSAFVVPPQRLLSSRAVEGTSIVEQPYASTPGADLWSTTRLQAKKSENGILALRRSR